jgi:hypothetical protein
MSDKKAPAEQEPLPRRVLAAYNRVAARLDALLEKLALDPMYSPLADMVPTLPSISFNENLNPGGRKDFRRFDNNLVVTK